jgi:hypothetical protein
VIFRTPEPHRRVTVRLRYSAEWDWMRVRQNGWRLPSDELIENAFTLTLIPKVGSRRPSVDSSGGGNLLRNLGGQRFPVLRSAPELALIDLDPCYVSSIDAVSSTGSAGLIAEMACL